jgi:thiosulfate/3-mercaptopyruvate sulfurtransferase
MSARIHDTLISASELASHGADADFLVIDCRFDLARPQAGEAAYRAAHLPGAIYAHLDRDLSGPVTPATGRHPLPAPEKWAATLGSWGLSDTTQVVAYDADNGMYAARLWWLLRWAGHRRVAVLDGGLKAWTQAGSPTSDEIRTRPASRYEVRPRDEAWLSTAQLAARLGQPGWCLLDARAPERFAGEVEPIDPVAGHVPGARNHPFTSNLLNDGRMAARETLRENFERSQAGTANEHTVVMCGSGVTACSLLLALEVAGKPGGRLYAGSWSEWIRDPARPVATGRT